MFPIDDDLTLPKKYIHSLEDTHIGKVTKENMSQGQGIDLPKNHTSNRTTAEVCRELLDKIKSISHKIYDPDAFLILKQQLTNITESFTKVYSSNGCFFMQRQTKQKNVNKKSSYTSNWNIALKETNEFDVIKQNRLLKF